MQIKLALENIESNIPECPSREYSSKKLTYVSQGEPRLHFSLFPCEYYIAHEEHAVYFRIRHGSQEIGGLFRLPTFPPLGSLLTIRLLSILVLCIFGAFLATFDFSGERIVSSRLGAFVSIEVEMVGTRN